MRRISLLSGLSGFETTALRRRTLRGIGQVTPSELRRSAGGRKALRTGSSSGPTDPTTNHRPSDPTTTDPTTTDPTTTAPTTTAPTTTDPTTTDHSGTRDRKASS